MAYGTVVRAQGPFMCGACNDNQIFTQKSKNVLKGSERVVAGKTTLTLRL